MRLRSAASALRASAGSMPDSCQIAKVLWRREVPERESISSRADSNAKSSISAFSSSESVGTTADRYLMP